MKIKFLIFVFIGIFLLQFVSAFSVGDFFNNMKNNPDNYYVLCDSENLEIISKAKSFADYFEIGFSKELAKPITTLLHKTLKGLTEEKLNKLVPLKEHNEKIALKRRLEQTSEARCIQDIIDLYRG